MNTIDEYDIREAFDALDDECRGKLSYEELQILYLGLGFSKPTRRMTAEQLRADAQTVLKHRGTSLTVEQTLKLFEKYTRDRSNEMKETFGALNGSRDGYLTPQDLIQASADVDQTVSNDLARHMIGTAKGVPVENSKRLTRKDFVNFFGPPDP